MKKRNTIIKARMGFVNKDDTVRMVNIKTGEEKTYANKSELNHLTEIELCKMTANKS